MEAEFEPVFSRQATAEGFRRDLCVLAALSKDIFDDALTSVGVKILGCRPMTTAPRTPGPASANLQRRKPREVGEVARQKLWGFRRWWSVADVR
jgi:hypothetical protein